MEGPTTTGTVSQPDHRPTATADAAGTAPGNVDAGKTVGVEFAGSGSEYFRVWIVNLALSILTLGIFSAWAKVRNKRYFYGNTLVDGCAFDYTANPLTILKGRIVMVLYVVAYTLLGNLYPLAQFVLIALTLPFVPWVINRSLQFNNRHTAHRGLRFGFEGEYWGAFRAFVLWPVLAAFTAGLLAPFAAHRAKAYTVNNSRFGRCHFAFGANLSNFYTYYAIALALGVGLILMAVFAALGTAGLQALNVDDEGGGSGGIMTIIISVILMLLAIATYLLILVVPASYVQTNVTNLVWQTMKLQRDRFDMQMRVRSVIWIQVSNLALIILTLGLFIPFAKVRLLKYKLSCFAMTINEGPQVYLAGTRDQVGAVGDELGDAFDLEIGI